MKIKPQKALLTLVSLIVSATLFASSPSNVIDSCNNATDTERGTKDFNRFSISAATYYDFSNTIGGSATEVIDFGYRITKWVGVGLNAGFADVYDSSDNSSYFGTISVSIFPNFKSRFSLIPTLGLGAFYGNLDGVANSLQFLGTFSVFARYDISEVMYCGFDVKCMAFSNKSSAFLAGIRIGVKF